MVLAKLKIWKILVSLEFRPRSVSHGYGIHASVVIRPSPDVMPTSISVTHDSASRILREQPKDTASFDPEGDHVIACTGAS